MHDAFLSDIKANPEDDFPRLVYADWLDENAQPGRAEFIRAQVALAKGTLKGDARRILAARAEELESAHGKAWLGPAADLPGTRMTFSRGFPSSCVLRLDKVTRGIQAHVAALFENHPLTSLDVREATLRRLQPFLRSRGAARIRDLTISNDNPLGPGLGSLLARSSLQCLQRLNIEEQDISEAGLMEIMRAGKFAHLRALSIAGNRLGYSGAKLLAAGPLGPLEEVWLDENPLGAAGMEALADSPRMATLRELHLSATDIGDEGATAIGNSPHLANLKILDLHSTRLGDEGACALGASPHLRHVNEFTLTHNPIGPAGAAGLTTGQLLKSVRALWLVSVPIGPQGMAALGRSGKLTKLTQLSLAENDLGGSGSEALARANMPALRELYCRGNALGDAFVRALMSASFLHRLRRLALPNNALTDESARLIAKQPALVGLTKLDLSRNQLTDESAVALAKSPHLGRLKELYVRSPGITAQGRARLVQRFGQKGRVVA